MRTTVYIAWLVAATLLFARLTAWIIDNLLWQIFHWGFHLPNRLIPFISCLNAAALLATSFAIVATCVRVIERRVSH